MLSGILPGSHWLLQRRQKASNWEFIWCWTHLHSQIRARVWLPTSRSREACWGRAAKRCADHHTFCWQMLSPAKPTAPWNAELEGLQLPQFPSTFTWWWQQHTVTSSDSTWRQWLLAGRHYSWWPQCKQSSWDGELLSSEFLPGGTMTTLTWATDITLPLALPLAANRYSCCWV